MFSYVSLPPCAQHANCIHLNQTAKDVPAHLHSSWTQAAIGAGTGKPAQRSTAMPKTNAQEWEFVSGDGWLAGLSRRLAPAMIEMS